jgi:hypothetical protein
VTKRFLKNPEHVAIDTKRRTVDAIEQTYYEVPRGKKLEALGRVLDMETPGPTIVFCHTRQETNDLAEALRLRGYSAESLNGEMSQADRERVLRRFRDGRPTCWSRPMSQRAALILIPSRTSLTTTCRGTLSNIFIALVARVAPGARATRLLWLKRVIVES